MCKIESADLSLTKADAPDPVPVGGNLTYTVTVTNNGPGDALDVVLTDALPAGSTFVSASPGAPTCTPAGGVVTCNLGAVANGASEIVTIVVTHDTAEIITNTASVTSTSPDAVAGNNEGTEVTTVEDSPTPIPAADPPPPPPPPSPPVVVNAPSLTEWGFIAASLLLVMAMLAALVIQSWSRRQVKY